MSKYNLNPIIILTWVFELKCVDQKHAKFEKFRDLLKAFTEYI